MLYIDASPINNPYTGIGKSINMLLQSLKSTEIGFKLIECPQVGSIKALIHYNIYIHNWCKKNLTTNDIFLIPNNLGKYIQLPHKRTWVIVHDLIPLSKYGHKGIKKFLYGVKMLQIKYAEKIITISETVKKQLMDEFNIKPEKIDVLYWPVNEVDFNKLCKPTNFQFSKPYFLSIGTGEPRKYVESIIQNWEEVSPSGYDLVLFGGEWRVGMHDKLKVLIKKFNQNDRIFLLGKVSEEELNYLYYNASGFIFPSLEEGFGLPPLEALQANTPIILPKTSINFELYGSIGNFYSIGNVEELKKSLEDAVVQQNNAQERADFCSKYSKEIFQNKLKKIFHEKKDTY